MEPEFVPPLDYAICPGCKEKVDLPKKITFRLRSKEEKFACPYCGSTIQYISPGIPPGPIE